MSLERERERGESNQFPSMYTHTVPTPELDGYIDYPETCVFVCRQLIAPVESMHPGVKLPSTGSPLKTPCALLELGHLSAAVTVRFVFPRYFHVRSW